MKRFQARRSNGRYTRNTLENVFGLHADVCPGGPDGKWCGRILPVSVGEKRRTFCDAHQPTEGRGDDCG